MWYLKEIGTKSAACRPPANSIVPSFSKNTSPTSHPTHNPLKWPTLSCKIRDKAPYSALDKCKIVDYYHAQQALCGTSLHTILNCMPWHHQRWALLSNQMVSYTTWWTNFTPGHSEQGIAVSITNIVWNRNSLVINSRIGHPMPNFTEQVIW